MKTTNWCAAIFKAANISSPLSLAVTSFGARYAPAESNPFQMIVSVWLHWNTAIAKTKPVPHFGHSFLEKKIVSFSFFSDPSTHCHSDYWIQVNNVHSESFLLFPRLWNQNGTHFNDSTELALLFLKSVQMPSKTRRFYYNIKTSRTICFLFLSLSIVQVCDKRANGLHALKHW